MGDVAKGIKSFKKGMASDVYKRQNKTTNITTIAICQIPMLMKNL